MSNTKEMEMMELEGIKNQLDLLGIKYHHNANLTTLQKLLADKQKEFKPDEDKKKSVLDEVLKPMLVNVTCLNPAKSQWRGEFIGFGNRITGRCKDFIPYNCPEANGIWVPKMVVNILRNRKFLKTDQINNNGKTGESHQTIWLNEFSVEVLNHD